MYFILKISARIPFRNNANVHILDLRAWYRTYSTYCFFTQWLTHIGYSLVHDLLYELPPSHTGAVVLQPGHPVLGDGDGEPGPVPQWALRGDPLCGPHRHRRPEQDDCHLWPFAQAGLPRHCPGRKAGFRIPWHFGTDLDSDPRIRANGSGCRSVPKSSVTFRMQKKSIFFVFFNVLIKKIAKLQNFQNMFDD